MAGRLGREEPLSPACWRHVLQSLQDKHKMFKWKPVTDDGGVLFPVIDATFNMLSRRQMRQFRLMVAVAPRVPFTTAMLANLWNTVRVTSFSNALFRTLDAYK